MTRRALALILFALLPLAGSADESVPVCHGYGCLAQADIRYSEAQLAEIRRALAAAVDAENERKIIGETIGRLYGWAGEQSDIRNDRGGNYADGSTPGKMDCIDHSTSTTRLLKLLEARGMLRWHRAREPELRHFVLVFGDHWSAVVEEKDIPERETGAGGRYVVDSWFVDNGQPAVILPLAEWKKGAGPDV
jgi:hypothetical protein